VTRAVFLEKTDHRGASRTAVEPGGKRSLLRVVARLKKPVLLRKKTTITR
jgi:hypothetical protein